jgi:spermidine synthase
MDGVEASHVDLADPTRIEFEYLRHLIRVIEGALPRRGPLLALQVGGGPCTLARYLLATRPGARMTVVERDAALVRIAREWLGLPDDPALRVIVGDGRREVARLPDGRLDLVVIDAFDGVVAPHHLLSAGFADEVRRCLAPGGLHAVNLIDIPPLELASSAAATLLDRYEHVALLADPAVLRHACAGNVVMAASDAPLALEGLSRRLAHDREAWELRTGRALARLAAGAPVLRDDVPPQHALATLAPLWGRTTRRGRSRPAT